MKARAGRCEGMKPFGSQADTERQTVSRILELRSGGMALDKIAVALNAGGTDRNTESAGTAPA